jgi:hypothetical protein
MVHKQYDKNATGNADGHPCDINECVGPLLEKISDGYKEIVKEHK